LEPERPHHRREFLGRGLTLGVSAAALAPVALKADDKEKDKEKAAKDEPKEDKETLKSPSEADARMELVLARFGKQLDDPAREAVRREIDAITRRAESLRKFALENGDGPFPVFHPYRAPLS
jgi:hypothetical protein